MRNLRPSKRPPADSPVRHARRFIEDLAYLEANAFRRGRSINIKPHQENQSMNRTDPQQYDASNKASQRRDIVPWLILAAVIVVIVGVAAWLTA